MLKIAHWRDVSKPVDNITDHGSVKAVSEVNTAADALLFLRKTMIMLVYAGMEVPVVRTGNLLFRL